VEEGRLGRQKTGENFIRNSFFKNFVFFNQFQ
jgi:hypothetical protein